MLTDTHSLFPPLAGAFRFLNPGIAHAGPSGAYRSVLDHLKANPSAKVLDLGCCFGHDARQLVKDGTKPDQIVACDLLPELMQLGFEMFGDVKDEAHLKGMRWEKVDVFSQQDIDKIRQPNGYHAIYVGSFIHLFPLEHQQKAVAAMELLLSKEKGSKIWGRQVGAEPGKAGPRDRIVKGSRGPVGIQEDEDGSRPSAFYHDVASLQKLFEEGHPETWDAEVVLYDWMGEKGADIKGGDGAVMISPAEAGTMKRLTFVVVRR